MGTHGIYKLSSAIALLGAIGVAVMWHRSFREWDKLVVPWPAHGVGIASASGVIALNAKLTNGVTPLPSSGWSSLPPDLWEFNNTVTLIGDDDPLAITRVRLRTQQFTWETVVGDPPSGIRVDSNGKPTTIPRPSAGDRYLRIGVPHWTLFATLLAFSAPQFALMGWRRIRRRRRILNGRCFKCGYDLRATPDRCPECGTDVACAN